MIRVHAGDARQMEAVADACVHLVVTSPPYPMIPQWDALFARLGATSFQEMHDVLGEVWAQCARVLVPGGLIAINIGDALRTVDGTFALWPNHAEVLLRVRALGLTALPYLLWKKPMNRPNAFLGSGFLPPNAYVTLDCEPILLFRKGSLRRLARNDPARTRSRFSRAERDRWFSQVWADVRAERQGPEGRRSAAFPPEIPRRLIRMFSVEGETVLDPFAGTGTTLWTAAALGREAIGFEVDALRAEELRRRAEEWTPRGAPPHGAGPPR